MRARPATRSPPATCTVGRRPSEEASRAPPAPARRPARPAGPARRRPTPRAAPSPPRRATHSRDRRGQPLVVVRCAPAPASHASRRPRRGLACYGANHADSHRATAPSTGWRPSSSPTSAPPTRRWAALLGLTEYDEALPDMSAAGIAARERAEDAWVDRLRELDDSRPHRRRADRPRPGPDGAARPRPDARLGRLAAQPRPLRRHRAQLGVRAAHRTGCGRSRAGARRWPPGCAARRAAGAGRRQPRPGARPPGAAAAGPRADRCRRALRPVGRRRVRRPGVRRTGPGGRRGRGSGLRGVRRARRVARRAGHRRLGHRRGALRRAAARRPRGSATAPACCATRDRPPTTSWPPTCASARGPCGAPTTSSPWSRASTTTTRRRRRTCWRSTPRPPRRPARSARSTSW